MSSRPGLDQLAATAIKGLTTQARTVTGNNLSGPVRIISAKELSDAMAAFAQASGPRPEEVEAKLKEQEARLSQQAAASDAALHQRIAELEKALRDAEQAQQQAVAKQKDVGDRRIKELENILASDDARARAAKLEAEVTRLLALVDRYESGLEFVTAIERHDVTASVGACDELKPGAPAPLAARLDQIKAALEAGTRAIDEGLKVVNGQGKGSLYAVADLLEHSIAQGHLRNEVLSIRQALGK